MAGDSGTSFPVAGLAVVALFLSTAFLAPRGFDLLRQVEDDAGRQVRTSQPAVEARLWEDPLEALRRHLAKLKDICASATPAAPAPPAGGAPPASAEARCQDGAPEPPATFTQKNPHDGLTVIAAMLPGGTFVGSTEARRRDRYAVLAGLNVAGYVPDNSERMSLLRLPRCQSFSGGPGAGDQGQNKGKDQKTANLVASAANDASPTSGNAAASPPAMMDMVYETFSVAPNGPGDAGARHALVAGPASAGSPSCSRPLPFRGGAGGSASGVPPIPEGWSMRSAS